MATDETKTAETQTAVPGEQANASELPHCPAPVSVVIFFVPSSLL